VEEIHSLGQDSGEMLPMNPICLADIENALFKVAKIVPASGKLQKLQLGVSRLRSRRAYGSLLISSLLLRFQCSESIADVGSVLRDPDVWPLLRVAIAEATGSKQVLEYEMVHASALLRSKRQFTPQAQEVATTFIAVFRTTEFSQYGGRNICNNITKFLRMLRDLNDMSGSRIMLLCLAGHSDLYLRYAYTDAGSFAEKDRPWLRRVKSALSSSDCLLHNYVRGDNLVTEDRDAHYFVLRTFSELIHDLCRPVVESSLLLKGLSLLDRQVLVVPGSN
jgi:hypothetical protein